MKSGLARIVGGMVLALAVGSDAALAAEVPAGAQAFIQSFCVDCHDSQTQKGKLDLEGLAFDLAAPKAFEQWVKVYDRVAEGEMPPKKAGERPDAKAVAGFLEGIGGPMLAADRGRAAAEGRAVWRRLNRYEYENAVRDLLGAQWLQVKDMLPEDGEAARFNKVGEALDVSHVQMASYLAAAEQALRQVMATRAERPAATTRRFYAREQNGFSRKMVFNVFNRSPERAVFPMVGTVAQPEVIEQRVPVTVGTTQPAIREKEAFGVVASTYEPLEIKFEQFKAPAGGRYKLRMKAYTFWAGPLNEKRWWTPDRAKTYPGRRAEPVTVYSEVPPRLLRWLGTFDVGVEPTVGELEVYLLAGETIRPDAARLFRSRPSNWHNPLAERDGMPGVAFQWLEVEGPFYDEWPTRGHKLMFGEVPLRATAGGGVEVESKEPRADAERLMRGFLAVAYRRPAPEAEVMRFVGVIESGLKLGMTFTDAMVAGYSAVLCSPGFVCLEERPGALDDHALAARLSFFLWNTAPDAELRGLADKGELRKPAVLRAQAERLLGDARARRFVDAFLDYWIDLRKIQATSPDEMLYPDYYLDDLLTESAQLETQTFFAELLKGNLPARTLVAADFAMLNERLAAHYGVPGVSGVAIRRVPLPAGSMRGGLLTQASVLKVTANGTSTSPVVRGAWVMERILGKAPPPPPPAVPAIEPDIRGATTIREQLEKHRAQASCAACHAKIDPAGFALESFDVMGGYRERYRSTGEGAAVPEGWGKNGQPFKFKNGPAVDARGVLPDGRAFADVQGLKKLLADDERQVARNLVRQLTVYATGARERFADRPEVEKLLDRAAAGKYGVRDLVCEVVGSEVFGRK